MRLTEQAHRGRRASGLRSAPALRRTSSPGQFPSLAATARRGVTSPRGPRPPHRHQPNFLPMRPLLGLRESGPVRGSGDEVSTPCRTGLRVRHRLQSRGSPAPSAWWARAGSVAASTLSRQVWACSACPRRCPPCLSGDRLGSHGHCIVAAAAAPAPPHLPRCEMVSNREDNAIVK